MKKIILISIVLFAPFMLLAVGAKIYVPEDFNKIQDAINSSADGDTILVAPGTYYENINFRGKNVLLSSHYLFDEDVSFINSTIIDGSNPQFPDTASVVLFLNGEENTAILQGFTITGGKGSKLNDPEVGGFIRGGGGIIIYHSSPTIRHNIIAYNETNNPAQGRFNGGGGIYVQFSNTIISNNIIYKNNSKDGGGALLGPNPGSIIRNNIFAYNTTIPGSFGGGGLFIRANQGKFINNTIANNNSTGGGGIRFHNSPTVNLENCIIYGNKSGNSHTQIQGSGFISITHSNIEGSWAGEGNINESPSFVDYTPFILQDDSPGVDQGNLNNECNDWEDPNNPGFALYPALATLRNDMGAYGGNQYQSMPFMHILVPIEIITENSSIESIFMPGDTVVISSKIVSPDEQSFDVQAVFKSADGSIVDTVTMVDNGYLSDSLAGDGWNTGIWIADTVNLYSVEIIVFLNDFKETVTLENAYKFTVKETVTGIVNVFKNKDNMGTMNQNYPNPFSNTTVIGYSISEPAFTSLKVYDILGKQVETLVNRYQLPGSYEIEFDASFLTNGVYFYKIKAGDFSDVKQLILFK